MEAGKVPVGLDGVSIIDYIVRLTTNQFILFY